MLMTRRRNSEFGGRAKAAQSIMRALHYHKALADHNIAGPLNALLSPIQALDIDSWQGQRSIRLSDSPQILKGFSLNHKNPFDAAIRYPIEHALIKEAGAAAVIVPELRPGINLFAPEKYPWFSIIISLGIVPDIIFTQNGQPIHSDYDAFTDPLAKEALRKYTYTHPGYVDLPITPTVIFTPWSPVKKGLAATLLELKLLQFPPDEHFALVLAIGIMYGIQEDADTIRQAPNAGAAKVLAVE